MKSINIQRTQSLLCELIPEALGELNDSRINSLSITSVDCKNGKYDAVVYFDGSDYNDTQRAELSKLLNKASGHIKSYCLNATSWYKCPDFKFVHDDTLESSKRLEGLFEQIAKKKKNNE